MNIWNWSWMTLGVIFLGFPIAWFVHDLLYPGASGRANEIRLIGTTVYTEAFVGGLWTVYLLVHSVTKKTWTPLYGVIVGVLLFAVLGWAALFLAALFPWHPSVFFVLISISLITLGVRHRPRNKTNSNQVSDATSEPAPGAASSSRED